MPDAEGNTGIIEQPGAPGCFRLTRPTKLADEKGEYTRSTPYPKGFAPTFAAFTLEYPARRLIPSRVFVSSMGDLFGKWVPDEWIEEILPPANAGRSIHTCFLPRTPSDIASSPRQGNSPKRITSGMGQA